MKTKTKQSRKLIALGAVLLTALAVFVPRSHALDSLTNGVVAYWPMDAINGSVLTPDVGPNSFDLNAYTGPTTTVPFNGANITVGSFNGPHSNINGNQNGTNALNTSVGQATVLGYIAKPGTAAGLTNLLLPPLNLPNWTISFWLKAGAGGGNSGNRMFAMAEVPLGNGPNILWDIAQFTTDNTQIDHFRRQVSSVINGIVFTDDNSGGDHVDTTNVVIFDNNWHNVTIVAQTVTNSTQPVIDPTQFGLPANGFVTVAWNSVALDSNPSNAINQVDTTQSYQVQVATNLAGSWTTLANVGGSGNGTVQTYIDGSPTNNYAFYRVQKPRFRLQTRTLYIDGKPAGFNGGDSIDQFLPQGSFESHPSKTGGSYRTNGYFFADSFVFGGFIRAAGEGGFVNASYSDAAVWSRALSTNDLAFYIRDGITNASVFTAPLFATLSAEYPAAAQGDSDLLSWQAAKPPATLTLTPGIGSVTAISSLGIGSTNALISSNTLFQLVASRSGLNATGTVSVACVSNVAPNWHYIDGFTYLSDGPIAGQGKWLNPLHGPATATGMGNLEVFTSTGGNNYAGFDGSDNNINGGNGAVAGRDLGSFASLPGNTNTLFFRFYIDPAATNNDPLYGSPLAIQISAGLSDIGILDSAINGGVGGGPQFTITQPMNGGVIDLTAASGASGITVSPGNYSYVNDAVNGNTNGLIAGHTYSVWVDVINNFPGVVGGFGSATEQTNAALYAVWLQRDDWSARTNLFGAISCTNTFGGIMNNVVYPQGYLLSPRDYSVNNQNNTTLGPSATVKYLYLLQSVSANGPTVQGTNAVRFDDFYISKTGTGFNGTVPVTAGSFAP